MLEMETEEKGKPVDKGLSVEEQLNQLREQVEDLTSKWKRAAADYANLEKRYAREKEESVGWASTRLLLKVLPVLDDLEKAVEAHGGDGLELILRKFREVLRSEGLEEIKAVDESFDPHFHECLEVVRGEEGKIVAVLRKGYKIGERVLRPAQVRVAKAEVAEEKL